MLRDLTTGSMSISDVKKDITSHIYNRLTDWGKNTWIPQEKAEITQKQFGLFYKKLGKKGLIQTIPGWDCALGQILDIDDPKIFSVLPYILTAYMYNFGEPFGLRGEKGKNNRFVKRYTNTLVSASDLNYEDAAFFGCIPLSEKQGVKIEGIGRLLAGSLDIEKTDVKERLRLLATNFVFLETVKRIKANGTFIIPNNPAEIEEFESKCTSYNLIDLCDGDSSGTEECFPMKEYYPEGKACREYLAGCFRWVFLTWYSVWNRTC